MNDFVGYPCNYAVGHRDQNERDHRGHPVRVTLYEEPPGGMMIHPHGCLDRFRD